MKKILLILYLISAVMYILILKELTFTLKVFYPHAFILLVLLYFVFGYCIHVENKDWQFIVYLLSLLTVLFYRISECGFNFDFYLWDWLPYLFSNKTIMVNVVGNILILIPFGIYVRKIILGLCFIILVEVVQVLFGLGMFDIVDIFLNTIGFMIGSLGVLLWQRKKNRKT